MTTAYQIANLRHAREGIWINILESPEIRTGKLNAIDGQIEELIKELPGNVDETTLYWPEIIRAANTTRADATANMNYQPDPLINSELFSWVPDYPDLVPLEADPYVSPKIFIFIMFIIATLILLILAKVIYKRYQTWPRMNELERRKEIHKKHDSDRYKYTEFNSYAGNLEKLEKIEDYEEQGYCMQEQRSKLGLENGPNCES